MKFTQVERYYFVFPYCINSTKPLETEREGLKSIRFRDELMNYHWRIDDDHRWLLIARIQLGEKRQFEVFELNPKIENQQIMATGNKHNGSEIFSSGKLAFCYSMVGELWLVRRMENNDFRWKDLKSHRSWWIGIIG